MRAAIIAPTLVLTLAGYGSCSNAQSTAGSGTTIVFPVTASRLMSRLSRMSRLGLQLPVIGRFRGRRATAVRLPLAACDPWM